MALFKRSLFGAMVVFGLLASAERARASDPPDIVKLKQQLAANVAAVNQRTANLVKCEPSTANCQIRLWVSQDFLSATVGELLNNQSIQYRYAGLQNGPNLDSGGGALGCGWYAEVTGLSAGLQLSTINPQWLDNPIRLSLTPAFHFAASAQVAGHVKGPAGPCSIFRWSCDCPLGGGFGTSVGVNTDALDQLNFLVTLAPSQEKLGIKIEQSVDKTLRLDLWVGLGQFGQVRFPVDVPLPARNMYSSDIPLLFGTRGYVDLPQGRKAYELNVVQPSVASDNGGIALLFTVQFVWQ